jgi:hypothetical protein
MPGMHITALAAECGHLGLSHDTILPEALGVQAAGSKALAAIAIHFFAFGT